jgi:uncharacterized repeat protein (TIGR01451 family)/fimbrial isopeptide formation D2 family protein
VDRRQSPTTASKRQPGWLWRSILARSLRMASYRILPIVGALLVLLGGTSWLLPTAADAVVVGTYPATPKSWKVYGKAVQLGASLVTNFTDFRFNDELLPQSSDTVKVANKLPEDAVIVGAWLYWGGSALDSGLDDSATFQLADGFSTAVSADTCDVRTDPTPQQQGTTGTHFLCRKDVTALVGAHPGTATWNGTYTLGGVQAKVANIQIGPGGQVTCAQGDLGCQGRHASWSLVLVYESKFTETTLRDIFLYDGFVLLDEKATSLGQISFGIQDFLVGDPPDAQLSYYAMEGDKNLGNPPQDPPGGPDSPACQTCFDFVQFNGTKLTGGAGNSQENNIMNSTPEPGVDLDTFDVSALLQTGQTTATFVVSSGNGSLADNDNQVNSAGSGELFLYAYTLLQINRKSPNFKNPGTKYSVNATEAVAGEVLTYTVDLFNNGPLDAESSILQLDQFPPPGTEYVAGSTTVGGVPVADTGGTSPLVAGLNLGNLTSLAGGNSVRTVTFKVKVKTVPGVAEVVSFGLLDYQYRGSKDSTVFYNDTAQTNTTTVKLVAPTIATPLLTASPTTAEPGGLITWTLQVTNTAQAQVPVNFSWEAPKEAQLQGTVTCSGGAIDGSTQVSVNANGGVNNTGRIDLTGLQTFSGATTSCTFTTAILSAAALTAKGVAPINGALVSAQGQVVVGGKTSATDDPNKPGATDATSVTLKAQSNLTTSTKTAQDLSPGTPLLPGDQVRFTVTVVNQGPGDAQVTLTDPLPAGLTFVSSTTPEVQVSGATVTAAFALAAGASKQIVFVALVPPQTAPGTSFANVATLSVTDGAPPVVVQTPVLTVQGGPDVSTSQKVTEDLNGGAVEPGDVLRYVITIRNTGLQPTGALQLVDPIDGNLEAIQNVTGGGTFDAGSLQVLWSLASLAPGGQTIVQFDARVREVTPTGATVSNVATLSGAALPLPVALSTSVKVQAQPNVSLFTYTVTSSSGEFRPGDTVTYTVTVQNTGTGAITEAVLAASFDPALTLQSASGGGSITGTPGQSQKVQWNLGTLAKSTPQTQLTVTGTLAAVLNQGQQVSSQAQLTGTGLGQPALSDDPAKPGTTDPTVFAVTAAPIITVVKELLDLNGGIAQGGDTLRIRLTLNNSGNAPAGPVSVTDVLHPALNFVSASGGSFDLASRTITWPVTSLVPGAAAIVLTADVQIATTTASGAVITNIATATFQQTPLVAQSNTVSITVQNLPDFGASTKAVTGSQIAAGSPLTYTITVRNSGNAPGTGIVVTDVLPAELGQVVVQGGSLSAPTRTATWTIPALAPGAEQVLTVQAVVNQPLVNGLQVCNQASIVAAENPTPSTTRPPGALLSEPTCFAVTSAPVLALDKNVFDLTTGNQINQTVVKPKTKVRYVLTARNTGNALANQLVLTDPVPAELTAITPLDGGVLDAASQVITWSRPTLGLDETETWTVRFEAEVALGGANGAAVVNQAALVADALPNINSDDPTSAAVGDPTVLTIASSVDFSKAGLTVVDDNGGTAQPGDSLTWTLTLQNDGDGTAKAPKIVLPVDSRLILGAISGGGTAQGQIVTWNLADLAPGQGTTLTLQTTLKAPLPDQALVALQGQISAQGFAAPVLTDADLATPIKEPTQVTVQAQTVLGTSAWTVNDLNGGPVEPGDVLLLTLTVRNTGNSLAQLLPVQAILPKDVLAAVQPLSGGVLGQDVVDWTIPVLSTSPEGDVQLQLQVTLGLNLVNGTIVQVAAQLPGVAPPPVATVTVEALPRFDASVLLVDDETGWVQQAGQTAPGHTLRLELTLRNTGKAAAQSPFVTVALPAGLQNLQLITAGGQVSGNSIVWNLDDIAPGGQLQILAKAQVSPTATNGQTLPFAATAFATGLPGPQDIAGPQLTVVQKPILTVQKTWTDATGGVLFPGDTVRFGLTVANVGNATATAVLVSDAVPAVVQNVVALSGGSVGPTPGGAGQTASWTLPELQPGQSATVELTGQIAAGLQPGSSFVNVATATVGGETATSPGAQVTVDYPTLQVQLGLLPEAPAKLPLTPGDVVTLQVQVQTQQLPASGVRVIAPIDSTVFAVQGVSNGSFDATAGVLVWDAATLAALAKMQPGQPVVLLAALRVKPTAPDGAQPSFVATAREGETQLTYTSPPQTVPIASAPTLRVTKTVEDLNGGKVQPLDVLRYTIAVAVTGNAAAKELEVRDVLPAGLELIAAGEGASVVTTRAGGTTIRWTASQNPQLQTVLPGQTVSFQLDVRVTNAATDGQVIGNQAEVLRAGLTTGQVSDDPETPAVDDPTSVQVRVQSVFANAQKVVSDDNGAPLRTGDTVTWRIGVAVSGTSPTSNARLIDTIPAGSDYVAGSTTLAGTTVADVGGEPPFLTGMPLNSPGQPAGVLLPGNTVEVRFQTRVKGRSSRRRRVVQCSDFAGRWPATYAGRPGDHCGGPGPQPASAAQGSGAGRRQQQRRGRCG